MRSIGPLTGIVIWLAGSGCASQSYHASALTPESTAAAFEARSLDDAGLRRFLTQNLPGDFSPAPRTWDFETLAWVAFYYNPTLDIARAQWEVARASGQTAATRPNPTLTLIPGYDTNAPAGVSPWLPAITADFNLDPSSQRDLRATAAQHEDDAARQAVFAAAWQVRSELRQALIAWSFARERAAKLHEQTALNRAELSLLEARFEAGAIESSAVLTARLALVRAETAEAEATSHIPNARQRVATALGLPGLALDGVQLETPALPIAPGVTRAQLTAARRQALQSRADLLGALARYEAAEAALELEINRQRPGFHLGPGYQWDQGENKWTLGLSFELPLFNHNAGPIAEAEARRHEAATQFLAMQAAAIAEIDGATAGQAGTSARLDHLRRARDELRRADGLTAARFEAGAADQLSLQESHLELATVETSVLNAEEDAALSAGRLEDALQIPFPNLTALAQPPHDPAPVSLP